ncbi:MAG TPA: metallophosphoesterase [Pyrinomonadaceae bacterium]|nr:metallophosphoesterase [Pyrinomonadaceae bacterium]
MKQQKRIRTVFGVSATLVLCAALSSAPAIVGPVAAQQTPQSSQVSLSAEARGAVAAFEARAKAYAARREALELKLPKLEKESTPEQIEGHKTIFQETVRLDREGAKQGDVFTPDISAHIREVIKGEFQGRERTELWQTVLEAETKGVPLRVNYPYPESKELVEMPPTLLLKLPQLPKQLRYRFVGQNLLLVDRENGLIVDFMTNALPPAPGPVAVAAPDPPAENSSTPEAARVAAPAASSALRLTLPVKEKSVRFLVVGDTGTGTEKQHELAELMHRYRQAFPFEFALLMGDNMYGGEKAEDFKAKFEDVYRKLLDEQVTFYASLGNHDESNQRFYDLFNMKGEEYYRIEKGNVAFYALNSNYMDKKQVQWLEAQLANDKSEWKIAFFHHPPYSSGGKHGSSSKLREIVEPIFLRHGVNVVLAGHEHFYERVKPQKGIYYFISGAGGKLRQGDVKKGSPLTEKAYDKDMSFMLVEVAGDQMHFQVISRTGETVDSGVITHQKKRSAATTAAP